MIVDYVSNTISSLRWNSSDSFASNNSLNSYLVCATYWEPRNELKVYSVNRNQEGVLELIENPSKALDCSVRKLATFGKSNVICCKENGNATLYSVDETSVNFEINEIKNWNLSSSSNLALTDVIVDLSKKSLVCSSEDGHLNFIDINSHKVTKSKEISKSSITCVELLNSSEYIFGNEIGTLKLYDVRKGEINMDCNLISNLSSINCVRKHKGNSYIIACGNDQGMLRIIDLRNTSEDLKLIAAHEASITELKYKNSEPNTMITSSLDGQLLKWTFSVDSVTLIDVHSIFGTKHGSSILSFDLNTNDRLAFSTDLESIYCTDL